MPIPADAGDDRPSATRPHPTVRPATRTRGETGVGASLPTPGEPSEDAPRVPREIALLRALSDAARDMHRSLSLAEVVRVATERARAIVGADEAETVQTGPDDGRELVMASATAHGGAPIRLRPPDAQAGGPSWEVCRTNRPLRLSWTDQPRRAARSGSARLVNGSWLGAPLVGSDGRNLGLIQLAGKAGGSEFSAGDEAILVQLARMASVAIENAKLYEAALDARSQLTWAAHVERVRGAELRAVIDAMGEPVLVIDASGRVDFANRAADAFFAGNPVQDYEDLLSRFSLNGPIDPVAGPVELAPLDRPHRWIELRIYPVAPVGRESGDGERAAGRIAVLRDVTAARQARSQREAFLGILSHELRTPITTIYAGSKVLSRDPSVASSTSRDLAEDISAEAERLFRLVEDLLVMTRIERGVLQLGREPVLLQRVVAAAVRLEGAHWPSTTIELQGPVDLPAVSGDGTYVEQVVRNLLSNAARYSPAGASVDVHLERAGDEVSCMVLDRGRGFEPSDAGDLFELFHQSPATAAQASGAGIGLFVCRSLVERMGGRIWARPRQDGGAEFGFALRLYAED